MKEMKSTLEQLGFKGKPLPMMTEFVKAQMETDYYKNKIIGRAYYDVTKLTELITQPLTEVIDKIKHVSFRNHSYINETEIKYLFEYNCWETIEQAINANVKLILK